MHDDSSLKMVSKAELADAVGQNRQSLWREIHANAELMRLLAAAHYRKRSRLLTPRQIAIIKDFMCLTTD